VRPLHYVRVRVYRRNQILGVILAAFLAGAILGAAWATKQQETYQRYETKSTTAAGCSGLVGCW
jgi:hypothetical protein